MSGLWMILVLAFLQADELLPAPKNEALPKPLLVSSNMEPQDFAVAAPDCRIGWGTDSEDRSMYLVIQLSPQSIAQFAAGGKSMELESMIPVALRGRVQKVIVRVGNGPVEQSPPESELDRLPPINATSAVSPSSSSPLISNLDMRSPVSIDSPRAGERSAADIVTTSGTTQLPVVPGLSLPATPSPVLPPTTATTTPSLTAAPTIVSTPIPSTTPPPATVPSTTAFPSTSSPTAWNNATGTSTYAATPSATYGSDGFAPMPRTVPSTLNPFAKSGTATSPTTGAPASYGSNTTYSTVPHLASNPTSPPGGYVLPTDNYSGYGTNQAGYVQNGYAQQGYAAHAPANPVLPIPQVATRPLPSTTGNVGLTLPSTAQREIELASGAQRGSLVPFFLVLSFILNVYFGLWLNHLSTKYRHLLGSVRGLTPSSLDA